ncbi:hypothetical protein Hanom_Chr13g01196461 [Helianthus anomalus]
MMGDGQLSSPPLSRHILTTRRCYCILTRLPFFELHFGVLNMFIHSFFFHLICFIINSTSSIRLQTNGR